MKKFEIGDSVKFKVYIRYGTDFGMEAFHLWKNKKFHNRDNPNNFKIMQFYGSVCSKQMLLDHISSNDSNIAIFQFMDVENDYPSDFPIDVFSRVSKHLSGNFIYNSSKLDVQYILEFLNLEIGRNSVIIKSPNLYVENFFVYYIIRGDYVKLSKNKMLLVEFIDKNILTFNDFYEKYIGIPQCGLYLVQEEEHTVDDVEELPEDVANDFNEAVDISANFKSVILDK